MTSARIDPTAATTADVFSAAHAPVLTVDPGSTVTVRSLDASGYLSPQRHPGQAQPKLHPEGRGHCLTGPIAVRGARPGQMLALHLRSMRPDPWGWTVAAAVETPVTRWLGLTVGSPTWLLWDLDVEAGSGRETRGFVRDLAPFLGVLGVAPAEPGEHSTIPPRPGSGGNLDCKELVAGSTLYLPIEVPGALLYLGDGHAAQGDGEVGGTAIECAMTTELTIDVVAERPVAGIHAEAPAGRITFGFDADLNLATGQALAAMVHWMQGLYDVDQATALALASTAVDLRVTQMANQTWGVHALLPVGGIR